MKHIKNLFFAFTILAMLAVPVFATAEPASAEPVYACLPTCSVDDGRFITIAGPGASTIEDEPIHLQIYAPSTITEFQVGVFDGDTGGMWDYSSIRLVYELYPDPDADGFETPAVMVAQWFGDAMTDDDWSNYPITPVPEALSASGYYIYHLYIYPETPGMLYVSNFKVHSDAAIVTLRPSTFSFMVPSFSNQERKVIYPNYPDLSTTTYDGTFDFYLHVPEVTKDFSLYDGDLDFGSFDGIDNDTDDPDTGTGFVPDWDTDANPQGVEIGAPYDDHERAIFRREPSVVYQVTDPNGNTYSNDNPSGDREWEQFRIDSDDENLDDADYHVDDPLPAGFYHVHMEGMDLSNLNAWRFFYSAVGLCDIDDVNYPCKDIPGNLYHTYTTCTDFANGAEGDLTELLYGVKKGAISSVAPGVLFYYSKVVAPASSFTIQSEQSVLSEVGYDFPYLEVHRDQVILWDATCTKSGVVKTLDTTSVAGTVTVEVEGATAGQVYYLSVKYSSDSVMTTAVSPPYPSAGYNFWTEINNNVVPLSADGLIVNAK